VVARMLANQSYVSCNVFDGATMRLGTPRVARPRAEWVIARGTHEMIADAARFRKVQRFSAISPFAKRTNKS
jgi:hypothetical protein